MRFLIVDQSSEYRLSLASMLRSRWPAAETDEWDPRGQGHPGQALDEGVYAAVLLDSGPAEDDGIRWVADLCKHRDPPPVLLITESGGEHLAVMAMKAGAADFLRKDSLTGERLARSIEEALREREARRTDSTPAHQRTQQVDLAGVGVAVNGAVARIPGYQVLRMIGEGGSAKVYLAERISDRLQLVLKVLDPSLRQDSSFLKRFVREYQLIAALRNEHLPVIFDQGFSGEHAYIAMEYFGGGDLKDRIRKGFTSLGALRVASQIARALDAIHARGVIHRDLKPQNILFRGNGRLALVDFGLAKDLHVESTLTLAGEVLATPRYMSPEQCLGTPADHRSDLYSLGVIFYEMLAGRKLFDGESASGLLYMHVNGEVPRLPAKLAGYQPIVDRLLAKQPQHRYQSARELFESIAI